MAEIQGIGIITVYVDDYDKAIHFYNKFLGFELKAKVGEKGCWGTLCNDVNMYIEGGHDKSNLTSNSIRTSVALTVESAFKTFNEFKKGGVELLHSEPELIGDEDWWFMFKDPAGNILEIFGEK